MSVSSQSMKLLKGQGLSSEMLHNNVFYAIIVSKLVYGIYLLGTGTAF